MTEQQVSPFPKAGDICQSCKPFWDHQELPPKVIISVAKVTENYSLPIEVCPWCDGDTILKLNGRK